MGFTELKAEAYRIATETYGSTYNYSSDIRAQAMIAYAFLSIAENMTKEEEKDKT
jgi:hypothetical protein